MPSLSDYRPKALRAAMCAVVATALVVGSQLDRTATEQPAPLAGDFASSPVVPHDPRDPHEVSVQHEGGLAGRRSPASLRAASIVGAARELQLFLPRRDAMGSSPEEEVATEELEQIAQLLNELMPESEEGDASATADAEPETPEREIEAGQRAEVGADPSGRLLAPVPWDVAEPARPRQGQGAVAPPVVEVAELPPIALPLPEFAGEESPVSREGPAVGDGGESAEGSLPSPGEPPSLLGVTSGSPEGISQLQLAAELNALLAEATPLTLGVLTEQRVNEQARGHISTASTLASRGAYFAARAELLVALRVLTQAADKQLGRPRHTVALAAGLRAIDEAGDFVPRGAELDADVDVAVIVASHRTEAVKAAVVGGMLPLQAADLYYFYAQKQLGASVIGSPAGSVALYSLGKLNSQIAKAEAGRIADAQRRAFTFQQAALIARPDNDLAAHELGVLMAEAGHDGAAEHLLLQVAHRHANPTVLRNLAQLQTRLGKLPEAAYARQTAAQLAAAQGGDQRVEWLNPNEFVQTGRRGIVGAPATPGGPATPSAQQAVVPSTPGKSKIPWYRR